MAEVGEPLLNWA